MIKSKLASNEHFEYRTFSTYRTLYALLYSTLNGERKGKAAPKILLQRTAKEGKKKKKQGFKHNCIASRITSTAHKFPLK